ncbi:biogenesis of lysosome-related organelles complex 1 subunit 2-like [Amphiura filiformis]|uniref:biogenesis of lysosome-related organelles complex 1 subunit 2-like n=1 Tax=Amphiura filiformis TaxID=82378 RepID=UPI003B20BAD5
MADVAIAKASASNASAEKSKEPEERPHSESTEAAVETGIEATGQSDVAELTRDMFSKMTDYLRGDLASTAEDYKLLEQMNRLTTDKYGEMKQMGLEIGKSMKDLNDKYRNIQPYLDQIDQVEESVANLEQAALRLEAYSKRLEAKFKQLEKK